MLITFNNLVSETRTSLTSVSYLWYLYIYQN